MIYDASQGYEAVDAHFPGLVGHGDSEQAAIDDLTDQINAIMQEVAAAQVRLDEHGG